ncbi:MAG: hypothetical protein RIR29_209 [Actinomycetota bacterium]|jgi:uncharacterized protein YqcC (DUF446 family)
MASKYEYQQHPHATARKAKGPAVSAKHEQSKQKLGINGKIGLAITKSVGTMWAAYAFFALSLISLPAAIASGDTLVIVAWAAQTFLQLVLLPIIIVGQNIQAASADARAIATYEDATAILEEAKEIQSHLAAQDESLDKLIKDLARVEKQIKK